MQDKGILFVVSSPSGAGKTTLCHRLMKEFPQLVFSISYTTRPQRPNESDGVDYHFVDEQTFSEMVAQRQFAEWAKVHGNRYGTSKAVIEQNLLAGRDILFDIDYQGANQLKATYPDDTVMVFILPPSLDDLSQRLHSRGTDAPEVVARRLAKATEELSHYAEYEFLLVNDDLELSYERLRAIYLAAHQTQRRQAPLAIRLLEDIRTANDEESR